MKLFTPILAVVVLLSLANPASALEITAPELPSDRMPENTQSFGQGLLELMAKLLTQIRPDIKEALGISLAVIAAVMLVCLVHTFSPGIKSLTELTGTLAIGALLLQNADAMIRLGAETITELSEYGKLLYPVMTAGLAAQGGVTASAALYAGTAAFDMVLSSLIAKVFVPGVYLFLALAAANSALGEEVLKKSRDILKNAISWCLKILLTVFTTYISVTGVVSGATDAATLKATKVTISSVVPVVGGILSDASEAVLVSAGLLKNAAGIYGLLAILAIFLEPFARIGIHYLILKATAAICSLVGSKETTALIEDFSTAMGLLLAMTGASCLLLLISTVCFLKGVG